MVLPEALQLEEALESVPSMHVRTVPTKVSLTAARHGLIPASCNLGGAIISRHIQSSPVNAIGAASVCAVCQKPEEGSSACAGMAVVSALS